MTTTTFISPEERLRIAMAKQQEALGGPALRSALSWSTGHCFRVRRWGVHMNGGQLPPAPDRPGVPGRVRSAWAVLPTATGPPFQDAADDLVQRLLTYVLAFRASGIRPSLELALLDLPTMDFLYQLGEIAAAGGDIRSRLFGYHHPAQ